MGQLRGLLQYPGDIALVGFTVTVPLIFLVLAFLAPRVRIGDKLQFAGLLLLSWLITSAVISAGNSNLLRWDQGLVMVMCMTFGIWVALHRMIADLNWRHRWLLHLVLALVFVAFLLFLVGLYGLGTSHHY